MAKITITDSTGLTADLAVRDDAPFARARGTKVIIAAASLVGDFTSPVDQISFSKGAFGAAFGEPSLLVNGAATFGINAGASGALSVLKSADRTLFPDDGVSAAIPIAADECWIGVELDGTLEGAVSAVVDGFGVGVSASGAVELATYTLVKAVGGSFPLLKDCVGTALENYSATLSAAAIRKQKAGTVNATAIGGTVAFTASYSLPVSVNPLASANLPFNYKIEVKPAATVEISGTIAVSGEFVVRSHKISDTELRMGVYKKQGTTLSAAITANAGIQATHKHRDLLATVLGVAFGGAEADIFGIPASDADAFDGVLQESLNRSVSIALNLACSASRTHEAAVLYSIDLAGGDPAQTDTAIAAALRGDWTQLDHLPNARELRNVVKKTHEFQHKTVINLLGVYNAESVTDFVRSCTILHDENGGVVITDKASASRIATVQIPYAADPDKLRSALADAFLATVTYSAAAKGKLKASISASQSYFLYKRKLTRQEMTDAIRLGVQLGLIQAPDWNQTLAESSWFEHTRVSVTATYNGDAAFRLFFAAPATRSTRTQAEFERIGRTTMLALIDPADPAGEVRRRVLANDQIWDAMDHTGAIASFGTIPGLKALSPTELGVIGVDWIGVRWWADSMSQISKQLAGLLSAIETSSSADPSTDPEFMKNREKVAATLAAVTRRAHAAFVGGWGLAVMAALGGSAVALSMDVSCDGNTRHYEK
ncbi:MAG: hypothetical protein ABI833_01280 [Acidobacteriota bacterium]